MKKAILYGCLVSPRKLIYLSPIWDDELHDWPLWNVQEVGVVVPPIPGQDRLVYIFLRRPGVVFVLQMKYTFIMILLKSNEIIDEIFSPLGEKWHAEMV